MQARKLYLPRRLFVVRIAVCKNSLKIKTKISVFFFLSSSPMRQCINFLKARASSLRKECMSHYKRGCWQKLLNCSFTAKNPYHKNIIWRKFHMAKTAYGKSSARQNYSCGENFVRRRLRSAKLLYGKKSYSGYFSPKFFTAKISATDVHLRL